MRVHRSVVALAVSSLLIAPAAFAEGAGSKDKTNHGTMTAPVGAKEAEAVGVINSIDAETGMINVTHEPVVALGWPKMTMNLPTTRRVDLSSVKPGTNVRFKLKLGRDKQFRIIAIHPAE